MRNSGRNFFIRRIHRKIFNCIEQIKIEKFKNKYKGKRCFIIGNGPSLRVSDLEILKQNNELCFGTHRIYEIFDQTEWRPTFYCAQDQKLILNSYDDINNIKNKNKFIGIVDAKIRKLINKSIFVNLKDERFYPNPPKFSKDIAKNGVYEGYTVTYMCLQIAVYMGFKEIYLLGMDHRYAVTMNEKGEIENHKGVQDHFSSKDKIESIPEIFRSTLAYETAKKYADEHGIKILNLTRGGYLEVFARMDFDELFT